MVLPRGPGPKISNFFVTIFIGTKVSVGGECSTSLVLCDATKWIRVNKSQPVHLLQYGHWGPMEPMKPALNPQLAL